MRNGRRAATLAIVLAACGLKNAPVAPELVRPLPPAKLTATSIRDGVRLAWRRPVEYTGGGRMRDLGGFDIERVAPGTGPYVQIGTLSLADQQRFRQERDLEWIDHDVQAGQEYTYRLIAFTLDGSRSKPSAPATIRYERPRPATREPDR